MTRTLTTPPVSPATSPITGRRYISYEDYLDDPSFPECSEWVDGEMIPIMSVNDRHSELTIWLIMLLGMLVEVQRTGIIRGDPFNMKTGPDLPGRAPDVFFLANEHLDRIQHKHLRGPADLVIEIVSPESVRRDKVEKLAEYEAGGVPEYWWIDDDRKEAAFFQCGEEGRYQRTQPDENGVYQSRVLPSVRLDVAWLWQHPLPETLSVLRGWGVL